MSLAPDFSELKPEITFKTSRSSGPGGQNVNKVNTRVTLMLDVNGSAVLSEEQKEVIQKKLASRITQEGILMLSSQEKRSQLQNKELVLAKLDELLTKAFKPKKVRKLSKPSKAAIKKRIEQKKKQAEKKERRRNL